MDSDPGEGIYRAMVEVNGMPELGARAKALGIRKGVDIVPDRTDLVHRPSFRPGDPNGLSCSPTIPSLPLFALPVEWGGLNTKTVVWRIEPSDLGAELIAQEDTIPGRRKRHISIGPFGTMTFDEYVQAIAATRAKWKK